MRDVIYPFFNLLTTIAKLIRPNGGRTIIAENLLLKQQLIIHIRSRQRAPNLTTQDRALLGFWSLFLNPRRVGGESLIHPQKKALPQPDPLDEPVARLSPTTSFTTSLASSTSGPTGKSEVSTPPEPSSHQVEQTLSRQGGRVASLRDFFYAM